MKLEKLGASEICKFDKQPDAGFDTVEEAEDFLDNLKSKGKYPFDNRIWINWAIMKLYR